MMDFDFEKELLDSIEKSLDGSGINPHWILNRLRSVIEKHTQEKSQLTLREQQEILIYIRWKSNTGPEPVWENVPQWILEATLSKNNGDKP